MYAVIETGGKQYRVELGTEIAVERLDASAGDRIEIERVLLVADGDEAAIGRPLVEGARVTADVVRQDRADKIVVFKYRPKARHRAKQGHRQEQTVLRVADIVLGRKSAAKQAEAARTERERLEAAAAEEAAKRAAADKALAAKLAREQAAAEPKPAGKAKPAAKGKSEAKPAGAAKGKAKSETRAAAKDKDKSETKGKAEAKPSAKTGRTAAARTQAPPPAEKKQRGRAAKKDG
ncbi:MAG TPA: 50S ribosomal protein L21 [Candidatus Limnocylindrales bacterium]|nr:50S ribosomal protein L21 [Candidatus Limnocylindrales bacterium]